MFYPLNYGNRKTKERINGFKEVEQAAPANLRPFAEPPLLFSTVGWKRNYQLFYSGSYTGCRRQLIRKFNSKSRMSYS
ncbi:MAG: hypothetical protein DME50_05990 [Verrucomicrobia bacterium]|nr:MAG: hypothetical protein DME50_05990 [Verrucomicrobiota bacterium]